MENNVQSKPKKRNVGIFLVPVVLLLALALVFVAGMIKDNKIKDMKNAPAAVATDKSLVMPLGNGKYSFSGPMQGGPYFCQSVKKVFNGIGAQATGPWIDEANGVWYPLSRAVVDGANYWPDAYVRFTAEGDIRKIETNNVPFDDAIRNDATGNFPVEKTDDAYQYDRNPNSIEPRAVTWEIPRYPKIADKPSCVPLQNVGYGINGIAFFAATDGQARDPAYEVSDACQGHPDPSHAYHYHIIAGNECLGLAESQNPDKQPKLVGYALDGFGIYSQYENGKELFSKDLDECHGKTSEVMWEENKVTMYHYVVTRDYPYVVGCFKGSIIDSPVNQKTRQELRMPALGA